MSQHLRRTASKRISWAIDRARFLCNQFFKVIQVHKSATADLFCDFKKLSETAKAQDAALASDCQVIQQLQAELNQWRSQMATGLREWAGVNGTLRAEAAATRRHCQHLRTATGAFQAQEALSLKQLCVQSNNVKRQLQQQLAVAHHVQKLSSLAQKLQVQEMAHGAHQASEVAPLQIQSGDVSSSVEAGAEGPQGPAQPDGIHQSPADLTAALTQLNLALARGQLVRNQVAGARTAVAAAQAKAAAGGSFLGTVVEGTPCLPGPSADLLQIVY